MGPIFYKADKFALESDFDALAVGYLGFISSKSSSNSYGISVRHTLYGNSTVLTQFWPKCPVIFLSISVVHESSDSEDRRLDSLEIITDISLSINSVGKAYDDTACSYLPLRRFSTFSPG